MGAMLAGAVINIIGDPAAIFVPDLGIQAAPMAGVLAVAVTAAVMVRLWRQLKTQEGVKR